MQDLEPLGGLAVGLGGRGELRGGGGEGETAERAPRAGGEHVGGSHSAKIGDEPGQVREAHGDALGVDDRQSEARTHQQLAGGANVDLRMDSRRERFGRFRFVGRTHRLAEPRQAARSRKGGEEEPVGPQGAADEGERAGQVVHSVEHANRDDQVERAFAERQAVLVALDAGGRHGEQPSRVRRDDVDAARAQLPGKVGGAAAEIESIAELAFDEFEALEQLVSGAAVQKIDRLRRGTVATQAAQPPVKRAILGRRFHARRYSKAEAAGTCPRANNNVRFRTVSGSHRREWLRKMRWHGSCSLCREQA